MVENLQLLQYANIGISAAGLGVSVIGFVLINKKLKSLELDISQISAKNGSTFRTYTKGICVSISPSSTLFERARTTYSLTSGSGCTLKANWPKKAAFSRRGNWPSPDPTSFNQQWFNNMTTALALSNSARIHCLLRADEMPAAHHASLLICPALHRPV